ncbi:MAG: hypothetical protein AVDCRST_MAG49-2139 [uncultured Thermomicrobiales bacterium]|uniref:Uncharacterized protein n=1 Tax=uncultured Thermomicrobiales bacterium TaxID=1645740 RepID=A0A6J4URF2_9BACT|nr:MAG: hypothetical protein AVDCRST_MAG49-2139 [uncultured Thermomicrobiales bacterium]
MLAGGDRLPRRRGVELVGDGDDDRVDLGVGEHRGVVAVGAAGLVGGRHPRQEVLGQVADRPELGVARLAAGVEVGGLGDLPAAEDAHPQVPPLRSHAAASPTVLVPPGACAETDWGARAGAPDSAYARRNCGRYRRYRSGRGRCPRGRA